MKTNDGGIERRQRVNLSDEAYRVIMSDKFTFAGNEDISYSAIISQIVLKFAEDSAAKRLDKKHIVDLKLLSNKPSRARQEVPSMWNKVMDYISRPDVTDVINNRIFGGSVGKFVKAIIEEYAKKPFTERELIYFGDTVDKIKNNMNKQLRIVTGRVVLIVKPYAIMTDKQSTYNYLVGYSASLNSPEKFEISSLRISRIKYENVTPLQQTTLNTDEIDKINQSITEKGVQFLRSELCNLKVELTEMGKSLFNTIVFQRPDVGQIRGNTYSFRCTTTQADFYFFKFGAEAKVIEPIKLRERFAERYRRATEAYSVEIHHEITIT